MVISMQVGQVSELQCLNLPTRWASWTSVILLELICLEKKNLREVASHALLYTINCLQHIFLFVYIHICRPRIHTQERGINGICYQIKCPPSSCSVALHVRDITVTYSL